MSRPDPIPAAQLPTAAFRATAKVRFGDCDPAGIIFFPNWFVMANAAMEDFFDDALGISFHALHGPRRTGTGYVHASADFFAPGLMGDTVQFTPLVTRLGGSSYALTLHIHRGDQELARLSLVTVVTNLDARRAIPIPDDLRAALTAYQSRCQDPAA